MRRRELRGIGGSKWEIDKNAATSGVMRLSNLNLRRGDFCGTNIALLTFGSRQATLAIGGYGKAELRDTWGGARFEFIVHREWFERACGIYFKKFCISVAILCRSLCNKRNGTTTFDKIPNIIIFSCPKIDKFFARTQDGDGDRKDDRSVIAIARRNLHHRLIKYGFSFMGGSYQVGLPWLGAKSLETINLSVRPSTRTDL